MQLSKNEQYARRNNVEISGVSSGVPDQEENIIKICKDSDMDINISHMDIEGCH